jgi:hypothetical protein
MAMRLPIRFVSPAEVLNRKIKLSWRDCNIRTVITNGLIKASDNMILRAYNTSPSRKGTIKETGYLKALLPKTAVSLRTIVLK